MMTTKSKCAYVFGCANLVGEDELLCEEHRAHPSPPIQDWPTMAACGCGWDGYVRPGAHGQRCPACGNPLT